MNEYLNHMIAYLNNHMELSLCAYAYVYAFFHIQEIQFVSGDSQEDVVISIVDDALPELNEIFCVSLILPEGGAVIGEIPEGNIPIISASNVSYQFLRGMYVYNSDIIMCCLFCSLCDYSAK